MAYFSLTQMLTVILRHSFIKKIVDKLIICCLLFATFTGPYWFLCFSTFTKKFILLLMPRLVLSEIPLLIFTRNSEFHFIIIVDSNSSRGQEPLFHQDNNVFWSIPKVNLSNLFCLCAWYFWHIILRILWYAFYSYHQPWLLL